MKNSQLPVLSTASSFLISKINVCLALTTIAVCFVDHTVSIMKWQLLYVFWLVWLKEMQRCLILWPNFSKLMINYIFYLAASWERNLGVSSIIMICMHYLQRVRSFNAAFCWASCMHMLWCCVCLFINIKPEQDKGRWQTSEHIYMGICLMQNYWVQLYFRLQ